MENTKRTYGNIWKISCIIFCFVAVSVLGASYVCNAAETPNGRSVVANTIDQDALQGEQPKPCTMQKQNEPMRLAGWTQCTQDSHCGTGHKCCPTKDGNRCFWVSTCP
jgi:hypothetical protein